MANGPVKLSEVLWDGPLFADEVGWTGGITPSLREQFDLQSLRVVPAKEAMEGVVSIYFRPVHRDWALVRYARRYRWIFDTLLRQGMSGERRLIDNGFTPDDIGFLLDIVPSPAEPISPTVYDILWRSVPFPQYINVASAICEERVFEPEEIIERAPDVTLGDTFVFERLIRNHLIERPDRPSSFNSPASKKNTISVDLDAKYRHTEEGREVLPKIVDEHDRIFVREQFEPFLINGELDPDSHLPSSKVSSGGDDMVDRSKSASQSNHESVLEEIEQDLDIFGS